MKNLLFIIYLLLFLLNSCITQKENRYIIKGTDYASKPPISIIGCEYDGLNYNVIDSIVAQFGKNYNYQKKDIVETYEWKDVVIKSISNRQVDIILNRRLRTVEFKDNTVHDIEHISLKIFKNGKDLLKPLKLKNRNKTQKFLNNIN